MKSEVVLDGKTYISASRASAISGYNSDYIGQLCRKNALDCRMVGRSWFVHEESLVKHKAIAAAAVRGRIQPNLKPTEVLVQVSDVHPTPEVQVVHQSESMSKESQNQNLLEREYAFLSFNQDWNNFLNAKKEEKKNRKLLNVVGVGAFAVVMFVFVTAHIASPKILTPVRQTVVQTIEKAKLSHDEVGGSLSYSASVFESVGRSVGVKAIEIVEPVINYLNGSNDAQKKGLVVLPASQNAAVNDQVKEYVKNSFSDEAIVIPDETGDAGVIKPIFKSRTDQEYVYVVVPVNDMNE